MRTEAAPGRSGTAIARHERRGNGRWRARLVGAAAARERTGVRTEPQAAVRSTLPEAEAGVPARVRAPVHGAVRSAVSGDARSAVAPSRGDARSRRSRRGRAKRGGRGGRAGDAVERGHERAGPATAVSAASRRASGARSDRRERRREGYPPEGSRPRSGLGRVARSRSDAPGFIVCIGEPVSIIGTIGICTTITVCTIGFTDIGTVPFSTGIMDTGTAIVMDTSVPVIVGCRDARLMSGRARGRGRWRGAPLRRRRPWSRSRCRR